MNVLVKGVKSSRRSSFIMCKEDKWLNRNIHKCNGMFLVRKVIDGELVYGGCFRSLDLARCERDFLESIGWDYSNL